MTILFERHEDDCACSYCGNHYDKPMSYGLNIPPAWNQWTAWYVIKFWPKSYLRWTNPWMKLFA